MNFKERMIEYNSSVFPRDEIKSNSLTDNFVVGIKTNRIYKVFPSRSSFNSFNIEATESVGKNGYKSITIGGKRFYSHRLIADTFLGPSSLDVNHIDGNRLNNSVENLEYLSRSENVRHGVLRANKPQVYKNNNTGGKTFYVRYKWHGKRYYLGSFFTYDEALKAFDSHQEEIRKTYLIGSSL